MILVVNSTLVSFFVILNNLKLKFIKLYKSIESSLIIIKKEILTNHRILNELTSVQHPSDDLLYIR